ncbi:MULTISPECIES: DMT family transporter [Corynebacterium]|uniref:EamA family transporter n=1 Tax=Corynebacterium TaxID=1716 RepID=UPI000B141E40|nr:MULTISPECIES: EamA family transporter [Corynebacterium]MCG7245923.1 EamA family transporter [Corynebacterium sp. ACRPX]MDK8818817.1 EamA family transporter [Corynebacterium amycolatum]
MSREKSQTEVPQQGPLLQRVNKFLTLPVAPVILVLIGSLGTQAAAVLVTGMLSTVGAPGISGLRMTAAAIIMVVLFRPKLSGMTRARAINIVVYGIAMGMMSMMIYAAIARLPQGVAVTIDFLGPCVVSFLGLKMWRSRLWAIVAFIGVALIAQPSNDLDLIGIGYAAIGAIFFGAYTLFSARMGSAEGGGMPDLALSVVVAAIVLAPFSVSAAPLVDGSMWATIVISGFIGAVIPYVMDTIAAGIVSAAVVGTLFALDPVIGAILGWAFSGDRVTWSMALGIVLIAAAGAIITWRGARESRELAQ